MYPIGDAATRMPHVASGRSVDLSSTAVVLQGQRVMFDVAVSLTPAHVERIESETQDARRPR